MRATGVGSTGQVQLTVTMVSWVRVSNSSCSQDLRRPGLRVVNGLRLDALEANEAMKQLSSLKEAPLAAEVYVSALLESQKLWHVAMVEAVPAFQGGTSMFHAQCAAMCPHQPVIVEASTICVRPKCSCGGLHYHKWRNAMQP